MPSIEELEEVTRRRTLEQHESTLLRIGEFLGWYLESLSGVGSFTYTEETQKEYVWLFLLTRSYNSARWANEMLIKGYYSQALTLIRTVWENWLTCEDCEVSPETVQSITTPGGHVPPFRHMAQRLSPEDHALWYEYGGEGTYGQLSTFAHPRFRALAVLLEPGTNTLRIGPDYDHELFLATALHLVNGMIKMSKFFVPLNPNPPREGVWLAS